MLTIKHITSEGETVLMATEVKFKPGSNTLHIHNPIDGGVTRFDFPLTGGRVYVMNDKGSTVAKYELEEQGR